LAAKTIAAAILTLRIVGLDNLWLEIIAHTLIIGAGEQASRRKAQPSLKSGALKPHSLRPCKAPCVAGGGVLPIPAGHAAKFTGNKGSAWRKWLAAAPVTKK
jgi:hypothetical protein